MIYYDGQFYFYRTCSPINAWHSKKFADILLGGTDNWKLGETEQIVKTLDEPDVPEISYILELN